MIQRIEPMLAVAAEPFDSQEHLYEVKWDGVRCLAAVEQGTVRLWGRELADYTERYPELDALRKLPSGTLVDGELVLLRQGRADLDALLRRHQLQSRFKTRLASRQSPVVYVVFDLLFHTGRSLMAQPLRERRQMLADLLLPLDPRRAALSDGVVGSGKAMFKEVVGQGHEGVMAKHLGSRYRPGRRSSSWRKIKPTEILPCVILGYVPSKGGFRSLLVAAQREGMLCYVGEVSCGLSRKERARLSRLLPARVRPEPIVPCRKQAVWLEPELYCRVRSLGWTRSGRLRGASFAGLIDH
ncbi:MAG: non-homologous end-joining DNA ligase [Planctomycetota bacterium]